MFKISINIFATFFQKKMFYSACDHGARSAIMCVACVSGCVRRRNNWSDTDAVDRNWRSGL